MRKVPIKQEYEEYYIYLEELRLSGETNMWGATPYLVCRYNLDTVRANEILFSWIDNYDELAEKYQWRNK